LYVVGEGKASCAKARRKRFADISARKDDRTVHVKATIPPLMHYCAIQYNTIHSILISILSGHEGRYGIQLWKLSERTGTGINNKDGEGNMEANGLAPVQPEI
jgi:hypothetical protein